MDFSKLDKIIHGKQPGAVHNGAQLKVLSRKYGGQIAATIAFNMDYHNEVEEMIELDFGWEQHLQQPWFPYFQADTLGEVMAKLVKFINDEVPDELRDLRAWAFSCQQLQDELVKQPGNGRYDLVGEHTYTFPPKPPKIFPTEEVAVLLRHYEDGVPFYLVVNEQVGVDFDRKERDRNLRERFATHTCPANYLTRWGGVVVYQGDTDPHGVFQYVRHITLEEMRFLMGLPNYQFGKHTDSERFLFNCFPEVFLEIDPPNKGRTPLKPGQVQGGNFVLDYKGVWDSVYVWGGDVVRNTKILSEVRNGAPIDTPEREFVLNRIKACMQPVQEVFLSAEEGELPDEEWAHSWMKGVVWDIDFDTWRRTVTWDGLVIDFPMDKHSEE